MISSENESLTATDGIVEEAAEEGLMDASARADLTQVRSLSRFKKGWGLPCDLQLHMQSA